MQNDPYHNTLEFGFLPGQTVVELGSGSGFYAAALSTVLGSKGHVYAVDIDPTSLIRLKKAALLEARGNIDVLEGDFETLGGVPLRSNLADGAVFAHTIDRAQNADAALEEAKRLLKKGGRLAIVAREKIFNRETGVRNGFMFERAFDAGRGCAGLIFRKG